MADKQIGKITHYFDKIGVAVVEVEDKIAVGEQIKISGNSGEVLMTVSSLQEEHQQLQEATKGQIVGMKVDKAVKEGDLVYKIE